MKLLLFVLIFGACWTASAQLEGGDQIKRVLDNLPKEKQKIFTEGLSKISLSSEKESIILYKSLSQKIPELDSLFKMLVAKDLNDEDASESRRKFLKFYISRTNNMPDTSDKSFDELIKDVKSEYLKLDPDTKYDVRECDHKIVELIGEQTEFDKKFYALPEEIQKAYNDFYGDAETGKEEIRADVKMHLKDPELFKIMLLKFKDYEVVFGKGSKEASEFLKFFTESIDNLKSDSDEELKKHREDVLDKWNKLDPKVQKEAKEYAYDLKDFIEKYD